MMVRSIEFLLMLSALLLAACTASETAAFVPAGVAQGQPTFLYLFSEN